jgi:extracellular elastinolytic metalloproteinase
MAGVPTVPEDFHALYDRGPHGARGLGIRPTAPLDTSSVLRLALDPADVQADFDDATGFPIRVASARPEARLSPAAATPADAVQQFLGDHGDLWGLAEADIDSVEITSVSRRGIRTVRLVQRVVGLEVFGSDMTVAVSRGNEILVVTGQLFAGASTAARVTDAESLSTEEAVTIAAHDLTRVSYDVSDFTLAPAPRDAGHYYFYDFRYREDDPRPALERPVRVKDVLFPLGDQRFARGVYIELWVRQFPAFSYVIDVVEAPRVLYRKNLTSDLPFRYRVHNTGDRLLRPHDSPAPRSPHPTGLPDGFQASPVNERIVSVESLLVPSDPWLPAQALTTRGNNCTAYADLRAPDGRSMGDVLGATTSTRSFDYIYDHSQDARNAINLQNSLVGMFFHVNWLHDRWYAAGFDEAAGNAQQNNFGRGGLDGDPVLAEGNDFSGTDNANMATPADGASPRMQMFEFLGPTPDNPSRTSNHDATITFHEMGHYITNRLIGNANGLTNQQGRAMGEGWGDFFGICMTSRDSDDFTRGAFSIGSWVLLSSTFDDNYYFGVRRYPYSVDMGKNPLTFRHISDGVDLPEGPPISPLAGARNSEVHNAGEVWCTALWDVFANLIERHGHAEAEDRMLRYVIAALELTPNRPTYVQARDAVVSAVMEFDSSDLRRVWSGFAKRGMGVDAVAPPSDSTDLKGITESFDIPVGLPDEVDLLASIVPLLL